MIDEKPREEFSLFELNAIVKNAIKACFPERYWIRAELSEVRENYSGHCYVEFIEKDKRTNQIIAKARGQIWANRWALIRPYFEKETGTRFERGINVMVEVTVEFHELYGYSLTINDIDPNYTVGDMERLKKEIIERLSQDGILEMNKELEMPEVVNRIAVISSATAAGYEDFMNQLDNNEDGFIFYTALFPAIMQGNMVEKSIIGALNKIYENIDLFDTVVIIRGGGATSELNSFNSYDLALNITQFPIPVIVGIGHERDETVLDIVAHTRVKTPTAAAEFIISHQQEQADIIRDIESYIENRVASLIDGEHKKLKSFTEKIPLIVNNRLLEERSRLTSLSSDIKYRSMEIVNRNINRTEHIGNEIMNIVNRKITYEKNRLNMKTSQIPNLVNLKLQAENIKIGYIGEKIKVSASFRIDREKERLSGMSRIVELVSPYNILKKGYSLTLKNGKVVRDISEIKKNDRIMSVFENGSVEAVVKNIDNEPLFINDENL